MTFGELLDQYLKDADISAKELSRVSGISEAQLSRYRRGKRIPSLKSGVPEQLAESLTLLGGNRLPERQTLAAALAASLGTGAVDLDLLSANFDRLVRELGLNMNEMAHALSYDPSYLSRVRHGQRRPARPEEFVRQVSRYVSGRFNEPRDRETLASLLDDPAYPEEAPESCQQRLADWLCSNLAPANDPMDRFLTQLNDFDLNEYIRIIRFGDMALPEDPIRLPSTPKIYWGIREMMEGELAFLQAAACSPSNEPVLLYSDMPMEEMALDPAFPKQWMAGMALLLKRGLRLNIIHNVERPFHEMMLGLESHIPMYMTGQITPYYLKQSPSRVFHHLLKVSGTAALSGEAMVGFHGEGRYTLVFEDQELRYYKERGNRLLEKALPLMEIYRETDQAGHQAFLKEAVWEGGDYRSVCMVPPLFTLSENLLDRILEENQAPPPVRNRLKAYIREQRARIEKLLEQGTIREEIGRLEPEDFAADPPELATADAFCEPALRYSYETYAAHVELTEAFAATHKGFTLSQHRMIPFRNIQIRIREGKWVVVSKNKAPVIHFVIRHPRMVSAIERFCPPLVE